MSKYLQLAPALALGATITALIATVALMLQRMGVIP